MGKQQWEKDYEVANKEHRKRFRWNWLATDLDKGAFLSGYLKGIIVGKENLLKDIMAREIKQKKEAESKTEIVHESESEVDTGEED
jgi:hypothetical protein